MIIKQTRIQSVSTHFGLLDEGDSIRLGVRLDEDEQTQLEELGISDGWTEGDSVLPPADQGPVSERNAEGDDIVHKDQPKETAYRQIEWEWVEWHGDERVPQSGIRDVPYERYPRTPVPPQSMELVCVEIEGDQAVVIDEVFEYDPDDSPRLKHGINLLLELFAECEVFTDDIETITPAEIRRVNWNVLPEGRHPWAEIEPHVEDVLEEHSDRERAVYEHRWQKILDYDPESVAVGRAGFRGYLIFGFPDGGIHVLESAYYGNATYILGEDWEELSRRTKAELLEGDLHEDRIIHREAWDEDIDQLLGD